MTISHASISDPNLHEPKGASTAPNNTAYISNGAGSGVWSKIPTQSLAGVASNGTANQAAVVDGSGAFSLQWAVAHGFCYFFNSGTPSVITFPSTYTKVAPTTIAIGGSREITEGTNARLTYTGLSSRQAFIEAAVTISQGSGADRDIRLAIYKNGVLIPQSESLFTAPATHKHQFTTLCHTPCVTGDFFEAFIRNEGASGDLSILSLKLTIKASLT